MKFNFFLTCVLVIKLPFSFFLSAQENSASQNRSAALIQETQEIIDESKLIQSFYELKDNESWREITEEVLASADTPRIGKESIRAYHRRIFVFKYPSDGIWIKGFISFTPDPEYNPLLILYRWGNKDFALMNPGVSFATYKNYTVISSTLRGGINNGVDEFGGKDVDDMKNLFKFVPEISKELGVHLQPSCVFMLGPSRGGMEMFLTLAHFPELQKRVNKIVSLSAILDLHQLIHDRPDDMKLMLEKQFGFKGGEEGQKWIAKRDPLNTVLKINPSLPILVIQGTADDRISLNQGYNMVNALKETGHDVSYWEVKGGNHVLSNKPYIMNDIAHWLESNSPCMSVHLPSEKKADSIAR